MNTKSFKKFAMVSAVALGIASYGTLAMAAPPNGNPTPPTDITATPEAATPTTLDVGGNVINTLSLTAKPVYFGQIAAIKDPVDIATMDIAPDDTITDDPGDGYLGTNPAALVADPTDTTHAAADLTVTAFPGVTMYVSYDNCVDLTDGTDTLTLVSVEDNLATPGSFTCGVGNTPTIGQGTTDATSGDLTFQVGAHIATVTGTYGPYNNGEYLGHYDVTFSY